MSTTDYHANFFAHELTRRWSSDSADKLAGAVAGAQVDLNPHQVDAALFAFNSPLSKGALLADEVGLGKTIEAGLVLSDSPLFGTSKPEHLIKRILNLSTNPGDWVISKEFNADMLAEAVCKLGDFTYAPSDTVYCQHGRSTERGFIYVTTQLLTDDQLAQLSNEVGQ